MQTTKVFNLPRAVEPEPHLQGAILGASEYLSRLARCEITRLCLATISGEQVAQGFRLSPTATLAARMGVSTRTVERWAAGDIQACNVNAERLLLEALTLARESTIWILNKEQERHEKLNAELSTRVRGGYF